MSADSGWTVVVVDGRALVGVRRRGVDVLLDVHESDPVEAIRAFQFIAFGQVDPSESFEVFEWVSGRPLPFRVVDVDAELRPPSGFTRWLASAR